MLDFYSLDRRDFDQYLATLSISRTHSKALMNTAYKNLVREPWTTKISGIPERLPKHMQSDFYATPMKIQQEWLSADDGSVKFVLELHDQLSIEAVLMPEKSRITLCLSSQVGCNQGCRFCHTGRMGLIRNLSTGEIVSQLHLANAWLQTHPEWLIKHGFSIRHRVTNLVFMGMGEPLDNVDAVAKAVGIFLDPFGFDIGMRKISMSTSGHLEGLAAFRKQFPNIPIALSLHAASDLLRSKLMPINQRWPLAELQKVIAQIGETSNRSVLIQYTLIAGVNDSLDDSIQLAELLSGLAVKINLIPLNSIDPSRFVAPTLDKIQAFKDHLHQRGFRVMIRFSNGQDINAACGQLVRM